MGNRTSEVSEVRCQIYLNFILSRMLKEILIETDCALLAVQTLKAVCGA